jgi:hypothetical protein
MELRVSDKFLNGQSGCANQRAESSASDFFVIGHGKRRTRSLFHENDVTSALSSDLPTEFFENAHHFASAKQGNLCH